MQLFRSQETDKLKQEKAREAIALALWKRWDKALEVNSFILSRFPDDVDAHNRLGKALIELGRYGEARDAFKRGLELYPFNTIAPKKLGSPCPPRADTHPQAQLKEGGGSKSVYRGEWKGRCCLTDQPGSQGSAGQDGGWGPRKPTSGEKQP